jgi:four helix bundle protein
MEPIKSFTELNVWKKGHVLVLTLYKVSKNFPKNELFGLTSQMQRASVSITSNIAEGFSRRTKKDKAHFYTMAAGSNTELQNQLLIARDLGYIHSEEFSKLAVLSVEVGKMLNALIGVVSPSS